MKLKLFFLPFVGLFSILIGFSLMIVLLFTDESSNNAAIDMEYGGVPVSEEVLVHRPTLEHYAQEYGIEEYIPVLLAIIQVESGGTLEDVMQSSESLGLPPNSLSTEESIEQGTKYFAQLLQSAEENGLDVETAIQAYNFGGGFIDYVAEISNAYSFELAESFAQEQANRERVTYSNPIAEEMNGGWRYNYGNMFYLLLISEYLAPSPSSDTDWIRPAEGVVSSPFGYRIHPIYGDLRLHTGIDIAGSGAIIAARSGTVTAASYNSSLGYFVRIDHGDGYESIYGHMQPNLLVLIGETVTQGQRIGTMGSTGTSTGVHLDFKILKEGEYVDPAPYMGF